MSSIEGNGTAEVIGMDATMSDCVAIVQTALPQGGKITYRVSLVRQGIGWKVSNVERVILSETDNTYVDAFNGEKVVSEEQTEAGQQADQAAAPADQAAAPADQAADGEQVPAEGEQA